MAAGASTQQPLAAWGAMSANLEDADMPAPPDPASAMAAFIGFATWLSWSPPDPGAGAASGAEAPMHDLAVFDRVHVIPRAADLGFMSGNRTVSVEVWNACRRGLSLTAIPVTGPAGVVVEDAACPQFFATLRSKLFVVDVSVLEGYPVANVVAWQFAGIDPAGTDLDLTGQRLILFSPQPNAEDAIEESYGYPNDVMQAWDGTEQRVLLRAVAVRELRFRATLSTPREAGDVATRLYAGGRGLFSVPFWPDAAPLASALAPGGTSIYLETAGRAFAAGGTCVLWRDHWTWEPALIDSVEADRLVLVSGAVGSWPAGSLCAPLLPARLLEAAPLQRLSPSVADLQVAFSEEAL